MWAVGDTGWRLFPHAPNAQIAGRHPGTGHPDSKQHRPSQGVRSSGRDGEGGRHSGSDWRGGHVCLRHPPTRVRPGSAPTTRILPTPLLLFLCLLSGPPPPHSSVPVDLPPCPASAGSSGPEHAPALATPSWPSTAPKPRGPQPKTPPDLPLLRLTPTTSLASTRGGFFRAS